MKPINPALPETLSITEFRRDLAACLHRALSLGQPTMISHRGRVCAQLSPMRSPQDEALDWLAQWSPQIQFDEPR